MFVLESCLCVFFNQVSILAALAHDSVWLYAQALNETLSENEDPYNGHNVTRRMWSRTVTGAVGLIVDPSGRRSGLTPFRCRSAAGIQGDVTIDDNGDRESAYMMYHSQSSEGVFEVSCSHCPMCCKLTKGPL